MTDGPLLKVTGLTVRYDRIAVVHGVDLEVRRGSVTGLLGANGAGKSTIMRAILGQRDARGEVVFDGEPISGLPAHRIAARGIALVPEGRMVFGGLSVAHNLAMGAYSRKLRHAARTPEYDRVLALFPELEPLLLRPAGLLSGGQQQMLAIGRALMAAPTLLVMDEPSLGLAPLVIERIYAAVAELRAAGTSILLAEQNARMALRSVDHAYVLQTGAVVEEGSAAELRSSARVEEIYLGKLAARP